MHPAWHPDPTGRHELRYWDGAQWTDHVSDRGVQAVSPLYPEAGPVTTEPVISQAVTTEPVTTEPVTTEPVTAEPVISQAVTTEPEPTPVDPVTEVVAGPPSYQPQLAAQPSQPSQPGRPTGGDAFTGISGELVDGRFSEVDKGGVAKQNSRMLRVRVAEPFFARQGSMVAYQGSVTFVHQGGGAARFLKKALTGEGLSLMRVEGSGDVFLADQGHHVHLLHLTNSGISINGGNVLAFSSALEWNVERVKGGSMMTGGLFNTTLRGTGWVAITTDGQPVVLDASSVATYADTDAVVAWSAHLQTSLQSSMSAGALIGRGSGEAVQVAFSGQGFVIVQPSEGPVVPSHTH